MSTIAFLTTFSTFLTSFEDTGLKSWVDGPCDTIVILSNLFASCVGMLPPPMLPTGPGWTHGVRKSAFMPSAFRKLITLMMVSTASPISSKTPSRAFDPSVVWAKNRLRSSKPPTPRFLFIGDSRTATKEYMATTSIMDAISILKSSGMMLK